MNENDVKKDDKWEFEDYAYTITGILVGFLLVVPEILYSQFGISFLGGGFAELADDFVQDIEGGNITWTISELRALSPMLFLLTTAIVFIKDAADARKSGGYKGSVFTHTFESLLEDAIYMTITTIMVYSAILLGAMYASWLAGPITWVLFIFIFPLLRKKNGKTDTYDMPWLLMAIFAIGIIAEVITGVWVAFPLSWLVICAIKLIGAIREKIDSVDAVFDVLYYAFSVILLALGVTLNFWMASWIAFPSGLLICWILSKFGRFKKAAEDKANDK